MRHIRRPLIALLVLFAGAIVIDRAGLAAGRSAMASWVYLLAAAAVAAPLVVGGLRRAHPGVAAALFLVPYWIARLVLDGSPTGPGFDPYLAATETAFLALAVLLARRLAGGLDEMDAAVTSVAFGESPAVPLDSPQATNEILSEMARSRRHDRPLSVTVLEPLPGDLEFAVARAAEEVQQALRRRFVYGRLARAIGDQLRRSDLLFEHHESGRFIVLSPETEADGTALLVQRVREAATRVGLDLRAGSASFPIDAFTFEQLVLEAERTLGTGATAPSLRAVESALPGQAP